MPTDFYPVMSISQWPTYSINMLNNGRRNEEVIAKSFGFNSAIYHRIFSHCTLTLLISYREFNLQSSVKVGIRELLTIGGRMNMILEWPYVLAFQQCRKRYFWSILSLTNPHTSVSSLFCHLKKERMDLFSLFRENSRFSKTNLPFCISILT